MVDREDNQVLVGQVHGIVSRAGRLDPSGQSLPEVYRRERENLRNTSTPPLKALWKALFGNIYVTDYLLPMAFALFAALFALVVG